MRIKSVIRALTLALLLVSGAVATKVATAQEFTVNLKDTDIQELIQFVSDVTGTTIVVDPTVKGKVKVVSSKPVTKASYTTCSSRFLMSTATPQCAVVEWFV